MRIVYQATELLSNLEASKREAKTAFGDDTVYLEKYIEKPRHIEFQVLADNYGKTVHLFERECSIQRRHQKLIEEAPSRALDPSLRRRILKSAKRIGRAVGYIGAGTIEFLLDPDGKFYFLEVNPRLQVEQRVLRGHVALKQNIKLVFGCLISGQKRKSRFPPVRQSYEIRQPAACWCTSVLPGPL